jgi:hypothetical protein
MRFVVANDNSPTGVNVRDYVSACLMQLRLPTTLDEIQIDYVYKSGDGKYEHILFFSGVKDVYLVVVVDLASASVHGHRLLDLNAEYGLNVGAPEGTTK